MSGDQQKASFASQGDLGEKKITVARLSEHAYAYTAEGDPNSGIVVGDKAALIIDAQATPAMAQEVIRRAREISDRPIRYLVLSHYHAVRVLGASAYSDAWIIASRATCDLIAERGQADFESEVGRFPRLFRAAESIPGLTHPDAEIDGGTLRLDLGGVEAEIFHAGRGHTAGDTVVWLPEEKTLFAGDLAEAGATPYCGDAYFSDWPQTIARLQSLSPQAIVPGRGAVQIGEKAAAAAFAGTARFVSSLFDAVKDGVAKGEKLGEVYARVYPQMAREFGEWVIFKHCMPFNVSRAFDEASGIADPVIWTAKRDREMWRALESAL
jgi:glyoxylase-like metal-dependent hydrolase (beta-lactamase superfamily II)